MIGCNGLGQFKKLFTNEENENETYVDIKCPNVIFNEYERNYIGIDLSSWSNELLELDDFFYYEYYNL